MGTRARWFAFDEFSELHQGGRGCGSHWVIVIGPFNCKELFRLIRFTKEHLTVPERDHRVRGTVHDQYRAMNVSDFSRIGEPIEGEQRHPGQHSKR